MEESVGKEERNMGVLVHILAFSMFVIPPGFVLGPLILWLIKREESAFIDYHGKQSLNFQISCFIYLVVSALLMIAVIGFILVPAVLIFWFAFIIVAAVKTSDGEYYRYPLTIPFIK